MATRSRSTHSQHHSGRRRHYSHQSSNENEKSDEKPKSVGNKLKELIQKYGRHALGVYLALSFIDFSVAFVGVHLIGADKLEAVKDWAMEKWYDLRGIEHTDNANESTSTSSQGSEQKSEESSKSGGWGSPMLWAEVAVAYTIHKTAFLPIRVGLTAAWTPKIVKWLTVRGWIGKVSCCTCEHTRFKKKLNDTL